MRTGSGERRAIGAARGRFGFSIAVAGGLFATSVATGAGSAGQESGSVAPPALGTLIRDTVWAPSLRGGLFGEAPFRPVTVYLPPSYARDEMARYPVLYLLHNYAGRPEQWTDGTFGGLRLDRALDSLATGGVVEEMIVVMPDAGTPIGSPYLSSALTGDWEGFLAEDLVGHVDAAYRTLAEPGARGIAGHSAGGYAALQVAFRRPDVFGSVYGLSPCCLGVGGELELLNLQAALLTRWLQPDAGCEDDAWYARIPLVYVYLCAERLGDLEIAFDMGREDPFESAVPGAAALATALRALGIAHVFERYSGDHSGGVGSRLTERLLPFFSRAFRQGAVPPPACCT